MFRNYKLEVNKDILLEQWFSNGGAGTSGGTQVSSGDVRGQKPGFSLFSVQGLDLMESGCSLCFSIIPPGFLTLTNLLSSDLGPSAWLSPGLVGLQFSLSSGQVLSHIECVCVVSVNPVETF